MDRTQGKEALRSVLKVKKNVDSLEKYVYDLARSSKIDYVTGIYQVVGRILNNEKLTTILAELKDGKVGWDSPVFLQHRQKLEEEDNFLTHPFEVEEGVLECRCGSKRTFSFAKQTRSADEGTSVFVKCAQCGHSWVICS